MKLQRVDIGYCIYVLAKDPEAAKAVALRAMPEIVSVPGMENVKFVKDAACLEDVPKYWRRLRPFCQDMSGQVIPYWDSVEDYMVENHE